MNKAVVVTYVLMSAFVKNFVVCIFKIDGIRNACVLNVCGTGDDKKVGGCLFQGTGA